MRATNLVFVILTILLVMMLLVMVKAKDDQLAAAKAEAASWEMLYNMCDK